MYYICMLQNVQSQKHVLDYMYLFYIKNKHTHIYIYVYDLYGFILNVYQMNICLYGNKGAQNTCIPLYIIYVIRSDSDGAFSWTPFDDCHLKPLFRPASGLSLRHHYPRICLVQFALQHPSRRSSCNTSVV